MRELTEQQRDRLAEALGDFGIYFMGACAEAMAGQRDPERWDHDAADEALRQFVEPVVEAVARTAEARALREFADRWDRWTAYGDPQVRGGAAYRARAEADRIGGGQ